MSVRAARPDPRVRDDWVIVGGGIHGTYFARELVDAGVNPDAIRILDRKGELLGTFRHHARMCGMTAMRSPHIQHLASDPFDLATYARQHRREDEMVAMEEHMDRPTLPLFLDHSAEVIDRYGIDRLLTEATVTGIDPERGGLVVRTQDGKSYRGANVLLAIGYGGRYNYPSGARSAEGVTHVWAHDRPPAEAVDDDSDCWVIGGGTTAAQLALAAAENARSVTLCTPAEIQTALTVADSVWLNWQHIERRLHSLPPGSAKRLEVVCEERKDGTMPAYLKQALMRNSTITIERGRVEQVAESGNNPVLTLHDGRTVTPNHAILATGFANVCEHPLVRRLADDLALETGVCGMPVLDDRTLAWRRTDGYSSQVYVSGTLSASTVGPFAGTIAGARRATERILGRLSVFT
jgi:voltage-gated potassium channel Kch